MYMHIYIYIHIYVLVRSVCTYLYVLYGITRVKHIYSFQCLRASYAQETRCVEVRVHLSVIQLQEGCKRSEDGFPAVQRDTYRAIVDLRKERMLPVLLPALLPVKICASLYCKYCSKRGL